MEIKNLIGMTLKDLTWRDLANIRLIKVKSDTYIKTFERTSRDAEPQNTNGDLSSCPLMQLPYKQLKIVAVEYFHDEQPNDENEFIRFSDSILAVSQLKLVNTEVIEMSKISELEYKSFDAEGLLGHEEFNVVDLDDVKDVLGDIVYELDTLSRDITISTSLQDVKDKIQELINSIE